MSKLHWVPKKDFLQNSQNNILPPSVFALNCVEYIQPEAVDMNGRIQMQGGENWILQK
jgi:hypothetical protein